jgi:hypothetical protein
MNQFITLPLFISYCEHVANKPRFSSTFETRLDTINHGISCLHLKHSALIPPKILDLIYKYYYIDFILYKMFILQDNRISYEDLYNELTGFMLFMDAVLSDYEKTRRDLYFD